MSGMNGTTARIQVRRLAILTESCSRRPQTASRRAKRPSQSACRMWGCPRPFPLSPYMIPRDDCRNCRRKGTDSAGKHLSERRLNR
jgi:hypothetical protein